MVLLLVVGDIYLPQRCANIPLVFRNMFTPGRIHAVFITGNVGSKDVLDYFRTVCPQVFCTRGQFDFTNEEAAHLSTTLIVPIEELRVGLIHGSQIIPAGDKDALAAMQRRLNVDILLSGTTHAAKVSEFDNRLFVNPGSITGAFQAGDDASSILPSFVLLDVRGHNVTSFIYQFNPVSDDEDEDEDENEEDINANDLSAQESGNTATSRQLSDKTEIAKNRERKNRSVNNGLRIKKKEWVKV